MKILMIKTCKCGKKFETKPSSKQISCNKSLMGTPRKEDLTVIRKSLGQL